MGTFLYEHARFRICGDRALLVEYGQGVDQAINEKVRAMVLVIDRQRPAGVIRVVPAYRSLVVFYDPLNTDPETLREKLLEFETALPATGVAPARTVEIPVLYGGEAGPDLEAVATHHGLAPEEVVRIHTATAYHIYAIGFAPGFPYLGGLDPRLHTPRLETPRSRVAAGSVGIAEAQTGIYPAASPGGWRLIGRTPMRLFDPRQADPIPYRAGDKIRFVPISKADYARIEASEGP